MSARDEPAAEHDGRADTERYDDGMGNHRYVLSTSTVGPPALLATRLRQNRNRRARTNACEPPFTHDAANIAASRSSPKNQHRIFEVDAR